MIDVGRIEQAFQNIVGELAVIADELRAARVLTENSTDDNPIGEALERCEREIIAFKKAQRAKAQAARKSSRARQRGRFKKGGGRT